MPYGGNVVLCKTRATRGPSLLVEQAAETNSDCECWGLHYRTSLKKKKNLFGSILGLVQMITVSQPICELFAFMSVFVLIHV